MAKPEWGIKRICQSCGARFYDLDKSPIVCPSCETTFDAEAILKSRRTRSPAEAEAKAKEEKAKKAAAALESEEAEADEIEDDDTLLDSEEDEDDVDVVVVLDETDEKPEV